MTHNETAQKQISQLSTVIEDRIKKAKQEGRQEVLDDLAMKEAERLKEENSKEDLAPKLIYPALARALMYNLHENALRMIGNSLKDIEGPRTLVVVGPGKEVLPYSENMPQVKRMLNGGTLLLMDYNETICDGAKNYLETKDTEGLKVKRTQMPKKEADTILIQHRNIKEGYSAEDSTIDAIDMTVAVHHVTQYRSDIVDLFKEAYRALKPGGFLHIGEGDVDMKYNERKLHKIANDLLASGETSVKVLDHRYHDDVEPRETNFGEESENPAEVYISNRGMVTITGADVQRVMNHFENGAGYKQLLPEEERIVMPFIDHCIEADFQGLIVPVREYYKQITDTCLKRLAPELHQEFLDAIGKEQSDAERGIVEFYSTPSMVQNCMKEAGFVVEDVDYCKHGPFWNVIARKPRGDAE